MRATASASSQGAGSAALSPEIAERVFGADPGLLGLRLPQGALGGLRPARLPVDLAARALRPGVPLRAAQRAADGLLPAGRAGPRGAAARDRDRRARRQPQRRPLPRRVPRRTTELRGASRCGSASATSRGCAKRRWRCSSPSADAAGTTGASPTSPRGRAAGLASLEQLAWAGALDGVPADGDGDRRGGALAASAWPTRAARPRGRPAGAAARAARSTGAGAAGRVGNDDRRLPAHRAHPRTRTRWSCCDRGSTGRSLRSTDLARPATAPRSRSPAWWSPASARRRPRGSSSCCSRTSAGRST